MEHVMQITIKMIREMISPFFPIFFETAGIAVIMNNTAATIATQNDISLMMSILTHPPFLYCNITENINYRFFVEFAIVQTSMFNFALMGM